ncbi:SH3 domain-containing protein [Magnetococcales bacterium HHB-1]
MNKRRINLWIRLCSIFIVFLLWYPGKSVAMTTETSRHHAKKLSLEKLFRLSGILPWYTRSDPSHQEVVVSGVPKQPFAPGAQKQAMMVFSKDRFVLRILGKNRDPYYHSLFLVMYGLGMEKEPESALLLDLNEGDRFDVEIPGHLPRAYRLFLHNKRGLRGLRMRIEQFKPAQDIYRPLFIKALQQRKKEGKLKKVYAKVISKKAVLYEKPGVINPENIAGALPYDAYVRIEQEKGGWRQVVSAGGVRGWMEHHFLHTLLKSVPKNTPQLNQIHLNQSKAPPTLARMQKKPLLNQPKAPPTLVRMQKKPLLNQPKAPPTLVRAQEKPLLIRKIKKRESPPVLKRRTITYRRLNATQLRVRSGPGLKYRVIGRLDERYHRRVAVLQEKNGWSQVRLKNNQLGWASSQYLKPIPSPVGP